MLLEVCWLWVQIQALHLLAVRPSAGSLTMFCLSFFVWKMPTSQDLSSIWHIKLLAQIQAQNKSPRSISYLWVILPHWECLSKKLPWMPTHWTNSNCLSLATRALQQPSLSNVRKLPLISDHSLPVRTARYVPPYHAHSQILPLFQFMLLLPEMPTFLLSV